MLLTIFMFLVFPNKVCSLSSYVVMDADSGRVLSSLNEKEDMLIASTTKVMTTLVALEHAEVTNVYCAGEEILEVYGSMIYIDQGECMTLYDLLVGLMLRSGNDAAMVIATNVLGYDNFISEMNKLASKIGMVNTVFENPHGLDDTSKNMSTAYDMAILMKYATNNKTFMKITSRNKYTVTSNVETHLWYNKNKLLSNYKYATGGKIGYTTKSGHIFVSSASKGSENLVISSFKDSDKFNTHESLYERYFKEYDRYKVLDKYTFVIDDDYYKKYHLYIKDDVYVMLSESELDKVNIDIDIVKKKNVKSGSVVGSVKIYVGEEFIESVNLYAISRKSKTSKFKSLLSFFFK